MDIIKFTPRAIEAVSQFRKTLMVPDTHYLRIGIRQKNETNKRLLIGFDEKNDKDKESEVSGIKIIYTAGEVFFFAGMMIDFKEQDGKQGFVFVSSHE